MTDASDSNLLFQTLPTRSGHTVGVACLNQPKALNGLSLDMARALQAQLSAWENDPNIALVILRGQGDKAFCAGGDLQTIYGGLPQAATNNGWANDYLKTFFQVEYMLDHHIHCYAKPVLCWANGIVMGGGAGLMMGASHRVGTETTRFAMPETTIGLFPDVGGTWLLNRMPEGVGRFLAMTGTSLSASDTHFLGIVNYLLPAAAWAGLLEAIQAGHWVSPDKRDVNDARLHDCLATLQLPMPEAGPLQRHAHGLADWAGGTDWRSVCRRLMSLETHPDPWLAQAAQRLRKACPATIGLAFEILKRGRHLSLAQVFQMEYIVALNGTARSDFREGIRALLIEKTGQPNWAPNSIDAVDPALIRSFFVPPWPHTDTHPLASLGK